MKIYLRTFTGKHVELDVAENESVARVKEIFFEREGFPPDQCRLVYAGKHLTDEFTLDRYRIGPEATIHVVLRLRAQDNTPSFPTSENPYPHPSEAERIISDWNDLAARDGFDADTHIVDPQAHYIALESLQRKVKTSSALYQKTGISWKTPEPEDVMLRLLEIQAPEWMHNLLLDAGDGAEVVDREAVLCLLHSYVIIKSVLDRFDFLVAWKFSHEFFSILIQRDTKYIAEIVKIPRTVLDNITSTLCTALANARYETRESMAEVVKHATDPFMDLIGHEPPSSDPIETCRTMAYLLDVGLVSYAGSHASRNDFQDFEAETADFSCNKDGCFRFRCKMQTLACLNGFLDAREVWVFEIQSRRTSPQQQLQQGGTKETLSILTTIDALSDIWGPVYAEAIHQDSSAEKPYRVKKYNVSKGCIRPLPRQAVSSDAYVQCHWYSWAEEQRRRFSNLFSGRSNYPTMSLDDKLLIGTEMTVKPDCTFNMTEYEMNYGNAIYAAGPKPSTWRFDGVAVSLELAAPKFAMLQIKGKAKRVPETTVKEHAWQKWSSSPESANPGILNNYFGVEISNCTGNARRVSLKQILLMNPIQELLERQIPGWQATSWGRDFKKALQTESEAAVFSFWRRHVDYRALVGRLISSVLDVLDGTGCNKLGFQAAFLHQDNESVINIDPRDNDWADLLKDSYLTATYAIVNEICLEYKLPDHSASICNDGRRYSVLQTKIGMETEAGLTRRFKIDPHGLSLKRINPEATELPILLTRESTVTTMVHLGTRTHRAKELLNQQSHDRKKHHQVILRASRESFGGMPYPRQRGLTKVDEDPMDIDIQAEGFNQEVTEEALSQLEIEAMIMDSLMARDVVEDEQKARC
ncbi:unnamed protein product [Clonostachys byssicola]|uniref:Ubiquitin-like domain-containing protein n=1 Tax=Clonostachys byssicola TaxID=160290 RepID=A0A9N9U185_9HYPO|nr:unnamed protein product [Clonostachys byssicola]